MTEKTLPYGDDPNRVVTVKDVAKKRGVDRRTVLKEARSDPRHPPPISLSGHHPRARKGFRAGPMNIYEALKDEIAERDRQRHLDAATKATTD